MDGVIIEVPAKNVILEDGVQATVEGKTFAATAGATTKVASPQNVPITDKDDDNNKVITVKAEDRAPWHFLRIC